MQISKIVYRSESFQSTLSFSFAKIEESIRKSSYAPSRRDWELSVRHQSEDTGDVLQDGHQVEVRYDREIKCRYLEQAGKSRSTQIK